MAAQRRMNSPIRLTWTPFGQNTGRLRPCHDRETTGQDSNRATGHGGVFPRADPLHQDEVNLVIDKNKNKTSLIVEEEARGCSATTSRSARCSYSHRRRQPGLWPIPAKDNPWSDRALEIAREAMHGWRRIIPRTGNDGRYLVKRAGNMPDEPQWPKMSFPR